MDSDILLASSASSPKTVEALAGLVLSLALSASSLPMLLVRSPGSGVRSVRATTAGGRVRPPAATSRSVHASPNLRVHFDDQAIQESANGREACRLRTASSKEAPRRVAARALRGTSRADHGIAHSSRYVSHMASEESLVSE